MALQPTLLILFYVVFIQSTDHITTLVIVGAPKNKITNNIHHGGQVYQCTVNENKFCTPLVNTEDSYNSLFNPNGNFLGGALDGEDHIDGALVICSPRASIMEVNQISREKDIFMYSRGSCIYRKQKLKTQQFININISRFDNSYNTKEGGSPLKAYFDYGYGLFGFDISFYNKVGKYRYDIYLGATISLDLTRLDKMGKVVVTVLPDRSFPVWSEEDSYFGYSVDSVKYQQRTNEVWFLAGEPRGNTLKGKAVLFRYNKNNEDLMEKLALFQGDEVGSYFGGSVLAVDVSNDKIIDILIGAPMTAGKTYDEGSVYFYKGSTNTFSFKSSIKLTGSSKKKSRFGTAMVSLGDFDLDGYNDVAVSAPYENDGEGAVYIYRGSSDGLSNQYSQKLVPSQFSKGVKVKGFGLGISRGNDIDKNGHNDIAIGAYQTDQVFIVKSYSIIDYQVTLRHRDGLYKNTTNFDVTLCLNYTKRSKILDLPEVEFNVIMNFDYRSLNTSISKAIVAKLGETKCEIYDITIRPHLKDVSPFPINIDIKLSATTNNVKANGEKSLEMKIPYLLGCRKHICTTGLTIELKSNRKTLILGKHKRLELEISVNNDGEPAYLCELLIKVPTGITLRMPTDCVKNHENYTCLVADKLEKNSNKNELFEFNVDSKDLNVGTSEIQVSVTSIGVNENGYKDKDVLKISVIASSTTYINGKSIPETIDLKGRKDIDNDEVIYEWSIGKLGPSPVELHVDILLPEVTHKDETIFQIISVKGSIDNVQVPCRQTTPKEVNWNEILPQIDVKKVATKRTIMVHCNNSECYQFSCYGDYLYNPGQIAVFKVKMIVKSSYLVSKFKTDLRKNNLIAYIPVALQKNSSETDDGISEPTPLLIFIEDGNYIPFWAYLLAAIIGTVLLILMVVGLYKCSFFNRTYKDKLEEERPLHNDTQRRGRSLPIPYESSQDVEEDNEDPVYQNY